MPRRRRKKSIALCSVDDCGRELYAKNHCKRHYMQVLRHGELTPEREHGKTSPCSSPGCPRTAVVRGYCRKHARQIDVYGRLTPEREYQLGQKQCSVQGCTEKYRAKGKCAKHYNQEWRASDELPNPEQ